MRHCAPGLAAEVWLFGGRSKFCSYGGDGARQLAERGERLRLAAVHPGRIVVLVFFYHRSREPRGGDTCAELLER
eukprot:2459867-Prymnesium_polylepis.1